MESTCAHTAIMPTNKLIDAIATASSTTARIIDNAFPAERKENIVRALFFVKSFFFAVLSWTAPSLQVSCAYFAPFKRVGERLSRKLKNHAAAVALVAWHYIFCRVHETLWRLGCNGAWRSAFGASANRL